MNLSQPTANIESQSQFDQQQIQLLRSLRNGTLLPQLLRTYREQATKKIAQIQAAVSIGDHETVRLVTHTLKSASFSVGAARIGQVCSQLEANARQIQPDDATALCLELSERYQSLLTELDAYITS